jgi:hypothetical protein
MMVFAILPLANVKPEFPIVVLWEVCVLTPTVYLTNVYKMFAILLQEIAPSKQPLLVEGWIIAQIKHATQLLVVSLFRLIHRCVTVRTLAKTLS